jgi:hypothetical protein
MNRARHIQFVCVLLFLLFLRFHSQCSFGCSIVDIPVFKCQFRNGLSSTVSCHSSLECKHSSHRSHDMCPLRLFSVSLLASYSMWLHRATTHGPFPIFVVSHPKLGSIRRPTAMPTTRAVSWVCSCYHLVSLPSSPVSIRWSTCSLWVSTASMARTWNDKTRKSRCVDVR